MEPLLLKKSELAAALNLSVRTLCRKLAKGEIPAPVLVGGLPRWRREEIVDWIAAGCPSRDRWQAIGEDRS